MRITGGILEVVEEVNSKAVKSLQVNVERHNNCILVIASEASTHSLRAEAAKLTRTNKAKVYLHLARTSKEKLPCCIPPFPVNSFPMSSKMYISVESIALYVFMQKKGSSGYLSSSLTTSTLETGFTGRVPGPLGISDAGKASSPAAGGP